jgi:protein-S-isoprenylcysteine O-methyltransferase Ste14
MYALAAMAGWALLFLAIYLLLAFGVRSLVQKARTGSTGFKGINGAVGSTEWVGVALALGALAPILDLAGVLGPIGALDTEVVQAAGGGLFFGGLVTTLLAQMAMGDSWRVGVDHGERTELVTDGPFAYIRNPIFAGMIPAAVGIALLLPSVVALLAVALLIVALEIQTRLVEEPYLLATHGDDYARYARRTGRFLPGVGRLRGAS